MDLSRRIGVSPFYWWADVPVRKRQNLVAATGGEQISESPSVKYRGIFINDELWGLLPWAMETFDPGNEVGPKTYRKVFELMLRLRLNYLWPSAGGKHEFGAVPGNCALADQWAIVMGSSHAEPILRSPASWNVATQGPWDYGTHSADLVAYWNIFDPKLIEMGAIPNLDAAKEAYDAEARAALAQLHEVPTGDTIEEDHRRGTQLIINYIRDKTGAVEPVERDGKIYMVVKDYAKMRQGIGMLLAELMRIKAEGDYQAAKDLINKYGVHFNTAWRDQVVERYKKLDLPTYWSGINPTLVPHYGVKGRISSVEIVYPEDIVRQQLRYAEVAGK